MFGGGRPPSVWILEGYTEDTMADAITVCDMSQRQVCCVKPLRYWAIVLPTPTPPPPPAAKFHLF